ncbi:methyl-accepting chemotaxis protein [Zobellella denitrificans]|jgi:methyl-accepting chemotaxis protein|uniref:Chemotaxis protein n=1 Tax=Zobellella denitrificans TaxID=347534 RepID=A0A231N1S1_9GAMM|nr:methyl-accepting chemotaxis protein [Zobellella denitrificans]ATG75718.1 chemotaxis protein [Zobellella denitrificans]OXS16140.1 methyl-accepting chemotaxis protein [Zobellella denitrificans]
MLNRLSIKVLLTASFAAMLLAVLAFSLYVYLSVQGIKRQMESIVERNISLLQTISNLRYSTVTYRRFALDYGLTLDPREHAEILGKITHNDEQVEHYLSAMQQQADSADVRHFIDDFRRRITDYKRMQNDYIGLIDNGNIDAARVKMLTEMLAPFDAIVTLLGDTQRLIAAEAEAIKDHESAVIDTLSLVVVALCLLLAAFMLATGIVISRKIRRPLGYLLAQMDRVRNGRLGQELELDRFARDELGQAAGDFVAMQHGIRELVREIAVSLDGLGGATRQLRQLSAHASDALSGQQQEIAQIATAMHQMEATFQEIALNTSDAAGAARDAAGQTEQSGRVVQHSTRQVEAAAEEIEQAGALAQALREDSARIGVVSQVIRDIAEQTNLLALNAAIEAARAGESGRGFAVVADEVRNLARRTQDSIDDINQTIGSLQQRAEAVTQAMDNSRNMIQGGVKEARQAVDSLHQISAAVERMTAMNMQIAAATEQQNAVAMELSRSVSQINEMSDRVAGGARQTSSASEDLGRLADGLGRLVQKFSL